MYQVGNIIQFMDEDKTSKYAYLITIVTNTNGETISFDNTHSQGVKCFNAYADDKGTIIEVV